jgi:spermidine synthase
VDALHLGGGGFTVPTYLSATRPGTRNVVVELDGELVELDRARLGVRPGDGLRVRVGDARVELAKQPAEAYTLVVGDAFGHLVVPWHLATREMVGQVRRVLRPDGVYAQNVIDYPPHRFVRAELATVAAEFPYVAVVATSEAMAGERGGNFVIAASRSPLPVEEWRDRIGLVAVEAVKVLDGPEAAEFRAGARVLTDDYAPVDQLLSR